MELGKKYICIQWYNSYIQEGDIVTIDLQVRGLAIHHDKLIPVFVHTGTGRDWWFAGLDISYTHKHLSGYFKLYNPLKFQFIYETR